MTDVSSTTSEPLVTAAEPDRRRMLGAFYRPLDKDWLFGLWLGLVVATTWAYATQPVVGELSTAFTLARWLGGAVVSSFTYLALLGVTVGLWRGYRLGRSAATA